MKKIKVSEATERQLNYLVAKREGAYAPSVDTDIDGTKRINYGGMYPEWSTDWAMGGPIVEREEIALEPMTHDEHGDGWLATRVEGPAVCMEFGPTMLIAAMRCYVVSHLGEEVDVPEELE